MPTQHQASFGAGLFSDGASPSSSLHDLHLYAWPSEGEDESSEGGSPREAAMVPAGEVPLLRGDCVRRARSRRPSKADGELDLCQLAGVPDFSTGVDASAGPDGVPERKSRLHDLHLYTWPAEGEDDECEEWRPAGALWWVAPLYAGSRAGGPACGPPQGQVYAGTGQGGPEEWGRNTSLPHTRHAARSPSSSGAAVPTSKSMKEKPAGTGLPAGTGALSSSHVDGGAAWPVEQTQRESLRGSRGQQEWERLSDRGGGPAPCKAGRSQAGKGERAQGVPSSGGGALEQEMAGAGIASSSSIEPLRGPSCSRGSRTRNSSSDYFGVESSGGSRGTSSTVGSGDTVVGRSSSGLPGDRDGTQGCSASTSSCSGGKIRSSDGGRSSSSLAGGNNSSSRGSGGRSGKDSSKGNNSYGKGGTSKGKGICMSSSSSGHGTSSNNGSSSGGHGLSSNNRNPGPVLTRPSTPVSRFFAPIRFPLSSSKTPCPPPTPSPAPAPAPASPLSPRSASSALPVHRALPYPSSPDPVASPPWFARDLSAVRFQAGSVSCQAGSVPCQAGSASPRDHRDPFSPQPVAVGPDSLMSEIPDEILQNIFENLEPEWRPTLGLVCRRWRSIEVRLRERLKLDYGTYYPRAPWGGGGGSHQGFLDFTLERVLPPMSRLTHVEITNVVKPDETPFTDDGLVLLGTWCKNLRTLRLNVASQGLTGRGVTAALLGCGRNLLDLELQRCPGVGREALKAIADYCPNLQSLSLKACALVSDQGLGHFTSARCRTTLRRLNLSQCRNVRDRGLLQVASSFPLLTSLDVSHCDVTDVGVLSLPACCPDLRVLSARGCSDLSNVCMKAFAATSAQLQELDIRRARWITAAGVMAVLKHCLRLRRVCIDDSITTDEVRQLAREQRVEVISVSSQHRALQTTPWF